MARRKKRRAGGKRKARGGLSWRRHFGNVAKGCFAERPASGKELGRCMKANL